MRILFVIGGTAPRPVGGHKVIYEYANRLSRRGHQVAVCFYPIDSLAEIPAPEALKWKAREKLVYKRPTWFALDTAVRKMCICEISDDTLPDADIVFATEISTAFPVAALSESKGAKFYFIQGFENWSQPDSIVRDSYRLGMRNIAVSHWLSEIVESASGTKCVCLPNPIDLLTFYEDASIKRIPYSVAVMFHEAAYKGFDYAWRAIERAKAACPALTVNMFGAFKRPFKLPDWVSYARNASEYQLKDIYGSSAIYVCASVVEGYGLTCVEAMACGCVLVVSDFQGSREYAIDDWNALVSPVRDVEMMSENIIKALNSQNLQSKLRMNGVATAGEHSWDEAVLALEKEMLSV